MSVLLLCVELTLGIAVPWWIVKRDLARLDEVRLGRAWTEVSFWSAVVLFGPLCLPFHFTKTRRSFLGLLLGLAWMVGAFAIIGLLSAGLGALLGAE